MVVKNSLDDSSVFVFLALRFTLAGVCMAVFRPQVFRVLQREETFAGARLGFFMFCGYAFQTAGLRYTTASNSGFITGSSVVLVPLILALFWGKRVTLWVYFGTIAAAAGLYFLTVPVTGVAHLNRGDVLTFFAAERTRFAGSRCASIPLRSCGLASRFARCSRRLWPSRCNSGRSNSRRRAMRRLFSRWNRCSRSLLPIGYCANGSGCAQLRERHSYWWEFLRQNCWDRLQRRSRRSPQGEKANPFSSLSKMAVIPSEARNLSSIEATCESDPLKAPYSSSRRLGRTWWPLRRAFFRRRRLLRRVAVMYRYRPDLVTELLCARARSQTKR